MTGFRLIALSPKGEEGLNKLRANDKKCSVNVLSENPLTISFLFKKRYSMIPSGSITWFVPKLLKGYGCVEGEDYNLEVNE